MKASQSGILSLTIMMTLGQLILPGVSSRLCAGPQGAGEEASANNPVWREIVTLKHEHAVHRLACSADLSAAVDEGGNSFVWSTKTGDDRQFLLKGLKNPLGVRFQFTVDGKDLYLSQGAGEGIMRFPVKNKKIAGGYGLQGVGSLGVSTDGETWMEADEEGKSLVLRRNFYSSEGASAIQFEVVTFKAKVIHAAISASNKWLAVTTDDGNLHIHRRDTLREMHTITSGKERLTIHDIQFSSDGERIAVARDDAVAKVYDTAKGEEIAAFKGHTGIVFAVAFSPDGKRIVSGGDDNTARIWDGSSGKELAALKAHTDSVRCVAFDPTGEILVTGSADKTVKLWQAK